MATKKIIGLIAAICLVIFVFTMGGKLAEDVDAGEIVVIQDPIDGDLHVYSSPGWVSQNFGTATHYKKSFQFWFSKHKDQGSTEDESIPVRFNDGGKAAVSGSVRVNLPTDEMSMVKLHSDFRSQEAIESALIRTTLEKAVYMTGPLMSSKESNAEKRNNLLSYIEDQSLNGVYRTVTREVKIKDELSSADKTVMVVEVEQKNGLSLRTEMSPLKKYNITIAGLSINNIAYDPIVEKQIAAQQDAIMQVQTAIANSKKAEQQAITVEQQGKAEAAKAKWDQEVKKAQAVTAAEQELEVQTLAAKTAQLFKVEQTLLGEGEAARKRATMVANGALEQKLATYEHVQKFWADAWSKYTGNIVPQIQSGGNATSNGMTSLMEMFSYKFGKDLALDLKTK